MAVLTCVLGGVVPVPGFQDEGVGPLREKAEEERLREHQQSNIYMFYSRPSNTPVLLQSILIQSEGV